MEASLDKVIMFGTDCNCSHTDGGDWVLVAFSSFSDFFSVSLFFDTSFPLVEKKESPFFWLRMPFFLNVQCLERIASLRME